MSYCVILLLSSQILLLARASMILTLNVLRHVSILKLRFLGHRSPHGDRVSVEEDFVRGHWDIVVLGQSPRPSVIPIKQHQYRSMQDSAWTNNKDKKEMAPRDPGKGVKIAIQFEVEEVVCDSTMRATAEANVKIPPDPIRRVMFLRKLKEAPVTVTADEI